MPKRKRTLTPALRFQRYELMAWLYDQGYAEADIAVIMNVDRREVNYALITRPLESVPKKVIKVR